MAKDKTNKERLICIENKIDKLAEGFSNHLEHHKILYDRLFKLFLVILGIMCTAAASLIIAWKF